MKRCVLISAGQLVEEDKMLIRNCLENEETKPYLVAADGGADYCRELGLVPDLVLGDFDSVSVAEREALSKVKLENTNVEKPESEIENSDWDNTEICRLPAEKDDTDTLAALKLCMERGYEEFHIFGGLGGRLDHTIANIQCLLYLKRRGCNGYLYQGGMQLFVLKNESVRFEVQRFEASRSDAPQSGAAAVSPRILSLFALGGEAKGVGISGMKYNLEDATLTNDFPVGISNEFTKEAGMVSVRDGEVLVIVQDL